MMHTKRRWSAAPVETPEELARKLTEHTWTLCTAFFVVGHEQYLFLNDATHEDGAGEYAVVKRLPDGRFLQVESITFSWCSTEKALDCIRNALAGEFDGYDFVTEATPVIETPRQHGRCHRCA